MPRSHHLELPHHDDPLHNHVLREEQADVARQVPIELEPGDALFFDSGIVSYTLTCCPPQPPGLLSVPTAAQVHRSYGNPSRNFRRAYTCVYGAQSMEYVHRWADNGSRKAPPRENFELIFDPRAESVNE